MSLGCRDRRYRDDYDETFVLPARFRTMTDHPHSVGGVTTGDQIVRRPRATDTVGRALRGVFVTSALPQDLTRLLQELDCKHH
jgi:hypothetical protein